MEIMLSFYPISSQKSIKNEVYTYKSKERSSIIFLFLTYFCFK